MLNYQKKSELPDELQLKKNIGACELVVIQQKRTM